MIEKEIYDDTEKIRTRVEKNIELSKKERICMLTGMLIGGSLFIWLIAVPWWKGFYPMFLEGFFK